MSRKYTKPMGRDLTEISISSGSCLSGHSELAVGDCTVTGALALETCGGGTTVYPYLVCTTTGGFAGLSCVNGTVAG